ncbi:MAG: DUF4870 domain-containing protein [Pseudomonadota bacterium]
MTNSMDPNADDWFGATFKNTQAVYGLYLLGFFIGITGLVGVVMAYMNRGKATEEVQTHYTYQIRTFWIGLLYSLIAGILMTIGIGFLLFIALAIWGVVRCVKGLQAANNGQGITDPETWLW